MRIIVGAACLNWLKKLCFHVARKGNTTQNSRPELDGRGLDQDRIECHVVKIVVQKGTAPAVARVARRPYARATLAPVARAADVISEWIGEEDVGTLVSALSPALESSTGSREQGEVGIVIHRNQHVCIFRIVLVSGQGADESDSSHARAGASALDEAQDFEEQEAPNRQVTVCYSRHHVRSVPEQPGR